MQGKKKPCTPNHQVSLDQIVNDFQHQSRLDEQNVPSFTEAEVQQQFYKDKVICYGYNFFSPDTHIPP